MTERPVTNGGPGPVGVGSPAPLLEMVRARRRFGTRTVLDAVSLTVDPGEIHLVVGPNGSGKSTLERIAAGLLRCHGGTVAVVGEDPRHSTSARRAIGFLGHQPALYDDLTPFENLEFAARLHGLADPAPAIEAALEQMGLVAERRTAVRRLSRGTVQRVAIARALVHRPRLLLWDEPLTGLDGPSVERVIRFLEGARADRLGVFLVSHDLDPLWRLPASVHVLHAGAIRLTVDTGLPVNDFRRRYGELIGG